MVITLFVSVIRSVLITSVFMTLGCQNSESKSTTSALCESNGTSDRKDRLPDRLRYKFYVGGVIFKELLFYNVTARRKIMQCLEPRLNSISFKFKSSAPIGAAENSFVDVAFVPSQHGSLNNYQKWRVGFIKTLIPKPGSTDLIKIVSKYSFDDYYCHICDLFFDYPVVLTDLSKRPRFKEKQSTLDSVDGLPATLPLDWHFRFRGGMDVPSQSGKSLKYSIVMTSENLKFENLPQALNDLEGKMMDWMKE